jgi:putative aldouronate transport system substrate-binding protein
MKKIIAGALALIMSIVFAGCEKKETVNTDGEVKELSYWVAMDAAVSTKIQSYNEVLMYKQREKDSGVHIKFIHPASGQEGEQFNLIIASRDLPDIIEHSWTGYKGGVGKAIDDNVIIALNGYLNDAPNFKNAMESKDGKLSPIWKKGSLTDDGKYYGFTTLNIDDYRVFGGPVIRGDWLNELGLSVPETVDDWTAALKAFKEKKGARFPLTGTISNLLTSAGNTFSGAFGVGNRLYVDGEKIKYGPMQDGYKEFITLLNGWYKDGLIDKDISTNQASLVDSKITKGDSGALVLGYIGSGIGRYLKQTQAQNPDFSLVAAPYPVKNKGGINQFPVMEGDVMTSRSAAVTTACKNPSAAVKWMDYWYGDGGYYLINFGVKGESYTMRDGHPAYTDTVLKNPDGLSINEALCLACRASAPVPGFKQAPEYLEQYYEYEQQNDALKRWVENVDGGRKTQMPVINSTAEEADELSGIVSDLDTFVNEMLWKFVTGAEPLDNYGNFRNTLKTTFKIERYVEITQAQYDRYLKR